MVVNFVVRRRLLFCRSASNVPFAANGFVPYKTIDLPVLAACKNISLLNVCRKLSLVSFADSCGHIVDLDVNTAM